MDARERQNERQRIRRARQKNSVTKRYEKTKNGFLMRAYRNMKSRVTGVQWRKRHLYSGKDLLTKDEFYEWSRNNPDFHSLFEKWEQSGYERKITPSVDRIDSDLGYFIENMRWVEFTVNCQNIRKKKVLY